VTKPEHADDHSSPSSAKVKDVQNFTSTPSCAYEVRSSSVGKIRTSGWRTKEVFCKFSNYSRNLAFQTSHSRMHMMKVFLDEAQICD
jgi:hypothetical protein